MEQRQKEPSTPGMSAEKSHELLGCQRKRAMNSRDVARTAFVDKLHLSTRNVSKTEERSVVDSLCRSEKEVGSSTRDAVTTPK